MLFIVYDNINHDERLLETLRIFSTRWRIRVVSFTKNVPYCDSFITTGGGKINYLSFYLTAKKEISRFNGHYIYLHDNYCSPLIKLIKKRGCKIIYDSSELYFDKISRDIKEWVKNKLFNFYEARDLHLCDVTVAANIERATIMKDRFTLKDCPIVFDNVHKITEDFNADECEAKFGKYISPGKKIVCYFGGIQRKRGTFNLIDAIKRMGNNYLLILAGNVYKDDYKEYKRIIDQEKITNIHYVGFLRRDELRYLLSICDVNVSIFDMSCINQIFCASGKVYEGLFEGKPVLVSSNPPFQTLCRQYKVGVSTNDFFNGLCELFSNYKDYEANVKKFIDVYPYESRLSNYLNDVVRVLGEE